MKILFVGQKNNHDGYLNDYMSDLLLHGLRGVYGNNVIDHPGSIHLYKNQAKNFDKSRLWGKGITTSNILDDYNLIDRTEILTKIKKKFFDVIIYGSVRRNDDLLDEASKFNNKIIFIDGEDDNYIETKYLTLGLYFKRELKFHHDKVYPISFAIPKNKIIEGSLFNPKFLLSPLIPGRLKTYIYEDELSYYNMYQNSIFSLTYKKAGWDCLRHYEILMNGSIPIFLNIEKCPTFTMCNFPKKIIFDINKKYESVLSFYNPLKIFKKKFLNLQRIGNLFTYKLKNFDIQKYLNNNNELLDYRLNLLDYTKNNLTTENLAKYVTGKLKN